MGSFFLRLAWEDLENWLISGFRLRLHSSSFDINHLLDVSGRRKSNQTGFLLGMALVDDPLLLDLFTSHWRQEVYFLLPLQFNGGSPKPLYFQIQELLLFLVELRRLL